MREHRPWLSKAWQRLRLKPRKSWIRRRTASHIASQELNYCSNFVSFILYIK